MKHSCHFMKDRLLHIIYLLILLSVTNIDAKANSLATENYGLKINSFYSAESEATSLQLEEGKYLPLPPHYTIDRFPYHSTSITARNALSDASCE